MTADTATTERQPGRIRRTWQAVSAKLRGDAAPWRTVDIVVAAVLAVTIGVIFWAWGLLWEALGPAFAAFPPGQAFMYGVWMVPGVLGMLIIRKPGAAVFTSLVAATVEPLLGSPWGLSVIIFGLFQGLLPEIVFLVTRYRRFALPVAMLAAAASGAAGASLSWLYYNRDWTFGWVMTFTGLVIASAVVIAGIGSWALVRALATTGVLDAFPSGRERAEV